MKIKEICMLINTELPRIKGIIDNKTGSYFNKGQNVFMDMQIDNIIVCPSNSKEWFGFVKSNYTLIYK